ncbi:MAG: hypothetical protein KAY13_01095 [Zoogloea sp.]|nr:hypothetical protein [Zoogloea sp.]
MAGQLVKQQENLSIAISDWHLISETIFLVTRSQNVSVEFTLLNTQLLYAVGQATQGQQLDVKISILGPGINNENDAAQVITYPSLAYTWQVFHPASGTLTLDPGHYVVTVQVKQHSNGGVNLLTAQKAYLAISGTA